MQMPIKDLMLSHTDDASAGNMVLSVLVFFIYVGMEFSNFFFLSITLSLSFHDTHLTLFYVTQCLVQLFTDKHLETSDPFEGGPGLRISG